MYLKDCHPVIYGFYPITIRGSFECLEGTGLWHHIDLTQYHL